MITNALGFLLLSTFLTFVLYPPFINFLYRFQLQEPINPDVPRAHFAKQGTPTAAGLLPIAVFLLLNLLFNRSAPIGILLATTAVLAILGLGEDIFKIYRQSRLQKTIRSRIVPIVTLSDWSWNLYKMALFPWKVFKEIFRALGAQNVGGVAPYQKIMVQGAMGAILALWLATVGGTGIYIPVLGKVEMGLFYIPLVMAVFLFLVNSVSVSDGLDGLVGGLLTIALTAVLALALILGEGDLAVAAATLIGGLVAFLYFNIYPARVFAGNVGALGWAGALVALSFLMERSFIILVAGGIFVAEGLSVLIQVGAAKLKIRKPFLMAPLHHHFEMKGWAETKVTMRFWLFGGFLAFLALYLSLL